MLRNLLRVLLGAMAAGLAPLELWAQHSPPPQTYSMTEINSMMVAGMTISIYRDGSKVLRETSLPPRAESPKGYRADTLFDLQAHKNWTWDLIDTSVPCGAGTFSGDWGDPFAFSASVTADLPKQHPKEVGMETVNGIATKVLEGKDPQGGGGKLWLDTKYGLIIKMDRIEENGEHQMMLEVKEFSLAKPPASVFALPPACANAPITSHSESTLGPGGKMTSHAEANIGQPGRSEERPANAGDFVKDGPLEGLKPSQDSCTVFFRIVRAGTMEPITHGFRVRAPATAGFRDVTDQMRDGVLRIDNVAPQFGINVDFPKGGGGGSSLSRQCFHPQTVLLLVVKNPEDLFEGTDWLWVKAGKYATPPKP